MSEFSEFSIFFLTLIIENSEKLEVFPRHVNFKECVLFEEVGNFRGFRVFDFDLYIEMKNWVNSEICVQ